MKIKNLLIVLLCFLSVFFATGCNNNSQNKDGNITPVIKIITANNAPIVSKEDYLDAKITLSDNKGEINLDNVDAGVRGRGNYTWTLDKKGYRIKFNKKQAMLSDYKCKSWALLPNYTDKTLLRNYYALNVAKNMDGFAWSSNAELVELYLNNEYLGVYLLCDQTQVNENRVDIEEGSQDVDTGYLIERDVNALSEQDKVEGRDYFVINNDKYLDNPIPYVLKSPEYPSKKDYDSDEEFEVAKTAYMAQFNYIKDYITSVFNAIQSGNFELFSSLCDVNSFVDYFLLDQMFLNFEIDRFSSFFMHKDKGGKLVAGPVWDYDLSAGYVNPDPESDLYYSNNWFVGLANSGTEFKKMYYAKLESYGDMINAEGKKLYDVYERNKLAINRNNKIWPIKTVIYPMNDKISSLKTYKAQLDYLVNYVSARHKSLLNSLSDWK